MSFAVTCVCVLYNAKYIVLIDWCAASASLGGTLHMSMCVISACKSAIVSPYTPALLGNSEFTCFESSTCIDCLHLL